MATKSTSGQKLRLDVLNDTAVRFRPSGMCEDEPDMYDTTMVSEYSEEIFQYMIDLEESLILIPNSDYMDGQRNSPDAGRLAA